MQHSINAFWSNKFTLPKTFEIQSIEAEGKYWENDAASSVKARSETFELWNDSNWLWTQKIIQNQIPNYLELNSPFSLATDLIQF